MKISVRNRAMLILAALAIVTTASSHIRAETGTCGGQMITMPFADVISSNVFFCAIAEAYFSGLTNGTSATTYSPSQTVTREQMAAFVTRTMDQSLKRGSNRAALDQFWTTQGENNLALTPLGSGPQLVKSDGADLWVAISGGDSVSRVRASDGRLVETWTGATNATGVLCAMGKVFVTGQTDPGSLYQIDPTQAAGAVTLLSAGLGSLPVGIANDGERIWTANNGSIASGSPGSISIVTLNPFSVTTVSTGFSVPYGILYDGANIWVTDQGDNTLKKLDSSGVILQSIPVGNGPAVPVFDGTNIWVPNSLSSNTVTVVRATGSFPGTVLATLGGNGLNGPRVAAFDGERILVTNFLGSSVSLWRASDLSTIGTFSVGGNGAIGACSDGLNFWITLAAGHLARF